MSSVTYKTCSSCNLEKPTSEFSPRKDGSIDGLMGRCKKCISESMAKYYQKNNEKVRAYRRNYGRLYRYGISENNVIEIIAAQGDKCPICDKSIDSKSHVDHDHETGKIRGILCKECNIGLGMFGDNPGTIIKAADYLIRNYECEEDN